MAGNRASKLTPIPFKLGVYTNVADRDESNSWKDCNRVRWHKSAPEKMGGWERISLTGYNLGVYTGVARALHDWSTLDNQQFIAIGTECKLNLVNSGILYDITPLRDSSNLTNPFTTTNGSGLVTVVDTDHRAEVGDHIFVTTSAAVGGITLAGDYTIFAVLTPDTYTFTAQQTASSGATGGGGSTIAYDIGCGLASNGERLGYGTGVYGAGTYGTPREVGSGVPARLRTWSLDNFGEDLLASPSGGGLYHWDKTMGPSSKSVLIPEAPASILRMLVNPEARQIIAFGCSGLDGIADPMRIRWASQETLSDWISTDENTAGGKRLDLGSRLITAVRSRGQILVWSDIHLYAMFFLNGDALGYGFNPLGACSIVGPNAAIDSNGVVYFMAFDDFMVYDGTIRILPCDVHTYVFGDFDRSQSDKVVCSKYISKSEVRWDYPSLSGAEENDGGENDRYVIHNYAENCWYYGTISRTFYHDVSAAITGFLTNPYGANDGYLYKHEFGLDEIEDEVTPQAWFLESYDSNVGGSDAVFLMTSVVPNFDRFAGSMLMTLKKKNRPLESSYQSRGPYQITPLTHEIGVRAKASQIAMRLESEDKLGEDFRLGIWQVMATPYGGRSGKAIVSLASPEAPVLTGVLSEDESFIDLSWTAGTAGTFPIARYDVYRSVNGGAFSFVVSQTFGLPRFWTDSSIFVIPGNTLSYYVLAVDSMENDSLQSNTVTIEVPEAALGCFLTALSPFTVASVSPLTVVLSPDGLNAYAPNNLHDSLSQYSRNPTTGQLTPLSPATVSAGGFFPPNGPTDAVVSADGAHLYLTNHDSGRIYMYSRNLSTGHLTALSPFTILAASGSAPTRIAITPSGDYVYSISDNVSLVSQYSRNSSTGQLTALSPASVTVDGAGASSLAISPDSLFAYVSVVNDAMGLGVIYMFSIASGGQLTPLSPAVLQVTGFLAGDFVLSSNGIYGYLANLSVENIAQFSRNASTGQLTREATLNIVDDIPERLAPHPDGCLYASGNATDSVFQFTSTLGVLSGLTPATVSTGPSPVGLAVSPDGLHTYVADFGFGTISQFSIS